MESFQLNIKLNIIKLCDFQGMTIDPGYIHCDETYRQIDIVVLQNIGDVDKNNSSVSVAGIICDQIDASTEPPEEDKTKFLCGISKANNVCGNETISSDGIQIEQHDRNKTWISNSKTIFTIYNTKIENHEPKKGSPADETNITISGMFFNFLGRQPEVYVNDTMELKCSFEQRQSTSNGPPRYSQIQCTGPRLPVGIHNLTMRVDNTLTIPVGTLEIKEKNTTLLEQIWVFVFLISIVLVLILAVGIIYRIKREFAPRKNAPHEPREELILLEPPIMEPQSPPSPLSTLLSLFLSLPSGVRYFPFSDLNIKNENPLDEGRFGGVYEAKLKNFKSLVAVKFPKEEVI